MTTEFFLIPREIKKMNFPTVRFISKKEQARYNAKLKKYGNEAENSLNIPMKGSNLFKVLLLNEMGIRTATLPELECAFENGMNLIGTFEDAPSVILRSAGDDYFLNDYLAKSLAKSLKLRSFNTPKIINGLRIAKDKNSAYGLKFNTENAQIIEAPDFDNRNHGRKFSRINPDYSIEFDDNGKRTLYTRDNGVSGLYLGRNLDLSSGNEDLAGSDDNGRVVVVSAEGTLQKNLENYVFRIKLQSAKQIREIEKRAKKAENYLRTGKF